MSYQRDYPTRLKIGIVGVGRHAYRNILPVLTYLPVSLEAVCDIDLALAERTAAQYGAPAAYASTQQLYEERDLDAVLLCVSQRHHPALAQEAFGRGLHVWMEKPPAMRAAEVEAMIAARGDRVCVVGFKKVFMPAAAKVREILAGPRFGPVQNILGVYPIPRIPEDGAAVLRDGTSTGWLKNGCHPLSLMLHIGGPVEAVSLHRARRRGAACILHFANGCLGNLHLIDGANKTQPIERYTFVGNDCEVDIDNSLRVTFQRGIPFDYETQTSYTGSDLDSGAVVWQPQNHLSTLENRAEFTQGIFGELIHFCTCVLDGRPATLGTLEDALEVMRVYEAALLSNGELRAVHADAETSSMGDAS